MKIEHKGVRDAINSLILSHPLFAGILIQQKFEAADGPDNPTFSVNGETFRFNPAFADSLSFDELKGVCAHEAAHLAACHHARIGNRDPEMWNEAADYAINSRLLADGFKLPTGCLVDPQYADKSAEDIYRVLMQRKPQSGQGQRQGQGSQTAGSASQPGNPGNPGQSGKPQSGQSQGNPSPGSGKPQSAQCPTGQVCKAPGNAKAAEAKAKAQVEQAIAIARIAGQLPGGMERAIRKDLQPRFDWKEVLHRFFQEITARDYSLAHPSRRWIHSGLILPSMRSRDIGRIVLAVDTSGSVSAAEVSAMVSEMRACVETYCENGIVQPLTVIYCDAAIQGIEEIGQGDEPNPRGGGGTAFAPVFQHLANGLDGAACLVYLTDGENSQSDTDALRALGDPGFPVLWGLIMDNEGFAPPFGETFRFDMHA